MPFFRALQPVTLDVKAGSSRGSEQDLSFGGLPARGGTMDYSQHALRRCAQRNLALDDVHYIQLYGVKFHKAGAVIYYLRRCDVPIFDRADSTRMRLVGSAVICTPDGQKMLTVWRNRKNGMSKIKHKPDRSQRPD